MHFLTHVPLEKILKLSVCLRSLLHSLRHAPIYSNAGVHPFTSAGAKLHIYVGNVGKSIMACMLGHQSLNYFIFYHVDYLSACVYMSS